MIRFLLNREEVSLEDARADVTVLEYLREHRQKCGTKEGCASGDCGACTVVTASVENDSLTYRALNSCITFVGALHGKQLLTVEDLAGADKLAGELHPVQQAMVEQHGSQCGFCTPGFVMSMFALYKNRPAASRQTIEEYLGGNLCRCTGYRPIVDAALQATRDAKADKFSEQADECIQRLQAIDRIPVKKIPGKKAPPRARRFHLPKSAQELAELLRQFPDARLLAGGTDLALEVTQQLKPLDDIIFLGNVAELRAISIDAHHAKTSAEMDAEMAAEIDGGIDAETDDFSAAVEIGAAVPLAECGGLLCAEYPDLAELLRRFGSTQVRNQATLGGNIANASPIADLPPVLLAVDASLVLQKGDRLRRISIEDYFIDYKKTALEKGEFIRSVRLPRAKPDSRFQTHALKAYKISKRLDDDISALCAVFNITLKGNVVAAIRTGFGGMAAIPKRALRCEQALLGQALDHHTLQKAGRALAEDFQPISDVRAGASYRLAVSQNLLERLSLELLEPTIQTRVSAYAHA